MIKVNFWLIFSIGNRKDFDFFIKILELSVIEKEIYDKMGSTLTLSVSLCYSMNKTNMNNMWISHVASQQWKSKFFFCHLVVCVTSVHRKSLIIQCHNINPVSFLKVLYLACLFLCTHLKLFYFPLSFYSLFDKRSWKVTANKWGKQKQSPLSDCFKFRLVMSQDQLIFGKGVDVVVCVLYRKTNFIYM
jgi:hypothetical protein